MVCPYVICGHLLTLPCGVLLVAQILCQPNGTSAWVEAREGGRAMAAAYWANMTTLPPYPATPSATMAF